MHRKLDMRRIALSSLGSFLSIALITGLSVFTSKVSIIPPFGATSVIAFVIPDSIFAHPRNILGGYFFSSIIGMLCLWLMGNTIWSYAFAVGLAIGVMQFTRTLHPPAAAAPILIILQGCLSPLYLAYPILSGSLILTVFAILYNNYIAKPKHSVYRDIKLT